MWQGYWKENRERAAVVVLLIVVCMLLAMLINVAVLVLALIPVSILIVKDDLAKRMATNLWEKVRNARERLKNATPLALPKVTIQPALTRARNTVERVKTMKFDPNNRQHTHGLLFFVFAALVVAMMVKFFDVLWSGRPFVGDVILTPDIILPAAFFTAGWWTLVFLLQRGMWYARSQGFNGYVVLDLLVSLAPWGIIGLAALSIFGDDTLVWLSIKDQTGWSMKAVVNTTTVQAIFWFGLIEVPLDLYCHLYNKKDRQVGVEAPEELASVAKPDAPRPFPEIRQLMAATGLDEVGPFPVKFRQVPGGLGVDIDDVAVLKFLLEHKKPVAEAA